jgi:hypothetical protein
MSDKAVSRKAAPRRTEDKQQNASGVDSDSSAVGLLVAAARLYPVPQPCAGALIVAGVALGGVGDVLLHGGGPPGLNLSLWIALVAIAGLMVHHRAGLALDRWRAAWLATGVIFAAGLAWRDAPPLKLLALGCATLAFALAAHRPDAAWVRRTGVLRYAGALALGALHAWTAAAVAFRDVASSRPRVDRGRSPRRSTAAAVARGLLIATPLVAVFGALLMSADAVFAELVTRVFDFDFERIAGHVALFLILAWLSTGYLRGFLTGTALPPLGVLWRDVGPPRFTARRPALGIAEVATVLIALDVLFLLFVVVQFRYLFGGEALIQGTPGLTYAAYARRGFFELVFAVVLALPVLLAADSVLDRRNRRDDVLFRSLAGFQIALVLAMAASALERLRLYRANYGLTESRFYAMVLLIWMGAMLLWLAATVLRGRRDLYAFGMLVSGLATVGLLFAINPDAIVARTNLARMTSTGAPGRFDVTYASRLSADAVPILLRGLPALPRQLQCPLARHILRRWSPERELPLRSWNWSVAQAREAVRDNQVRLRSLPGPGQECPAP